MVGFLLDMAARVSGGNQFELPMSRQDIADYLGLTIETVSRTISAWERGGTDATGQRWVEIREPEPLREIANGPSAAGM